MSALDVIGKQMKYPHIHIKPEMAEQIKNGQWSVEEVIEGVRAALTRVANPRKGLKIVQSPLLEGDWKSANQYIEDLK